MTETPSSILSLRDVAVRFGPQTVLEGVNVDIHRNETVAVIGESGCGKTVLLKLIVGLLKQTSGKVLFEGISIEGMMQAELTAPPATLVHAMQRIGTAPETGTAAYGDLMAERNLLAATTAAAERMKCPAEMAAKLPQ